MPGKRTVWLTVMAVLFSLFSLPINFEVSSAADQEGVSVVVNGIYLFSLPINLDLSPSVYEETVRIRKLADVEVTLDGVLAIASDSAGLGLTQVSPVVMSSLDQPRAQTDLVTGNWGYQVTISPITEATSDSGARATPASTTFRVELLRDDIILHTLYVQSTPDPASGEAIEVVFDLGTSTLRAEESFLVRVSPADSSSGSEVLRE